MQDAFALIKIGFKFGVLGRLTEIEDSISRDFFETSKIIKVVLNWVRNFKGKLSNSFVTSSIFFASLRALKHDFSLNSLKFGGIITITTVTANLFLSLILQRQIILWGWGMRGLLLFIGVCALFCNASWEDIKKTSKVNKMLTKGRN